MRKNKPLVDESAREKAERDLSRSFAVEAGAGTGKTTVLVRRVMSIIENTGTRVGKIVAITFTEMAAAELKMRLRESLEEKARNGGGNAAVLKKALEELPGAHISTIHAFCSAMLRERPVEARIDPAFEQLDAGGEKELFDELFDGWLKKELEGKPDALMRALAEGFIIA